LEACAGLAAIIKAVCILESGIIPPTIHFKKGNPKIKFDEWNLKVPTELTPWPTQGLRRISTNSFGYGGTNCHAILDDASHYLQNRGIRGNYYRKTSIQSNGAGTDRCHTNGTHTNGSDANGASKLNGLLDCHRSRVFLISAQDKEGLKRVKSTLADFLDRKNAEIRQSSKEEEIFLADLAHSLNTRRSLLCWKTYGIASSLKDLRQTLRDDHSTALVSRSSRSPRIGFIFTGQGAQWARMGAELIEYKIFRESVEAADTYLRDHLECKWSIAEEFQKTKSTSRLHLAVCSQTLCTVLQVALVELLKTWNISPVAVAGHSAGEMAAAYCAGAIGREDAWKIAYWRGVLSSGLKDIAPNIRGAMMAVGLTPKAAKLWISKTTKGEVIVACVNAPTSVTLSGDAAGIDELAELLKEADVFARKLQVDTAYHSPHMQILASDCSEAIADIKTLIPSGTCSMHSSVTEFGIEPSELGPAYWVRNMTSPVQFAPAINDLLRPMNNKGIRALENAVDVLIEIGPHCALQGPVTQTLKASGITNIPYMSALVRNQDAISSALNLVGALVAQGFPVDIPCANNDVGITSYTPKPLVDLPVYSWNHSQTYWTESRIGKEYRLRKYPCLSLLGAPAPSMVAEEATWRGFIRLSEEPWVADHKIQGSILYPAAGFLAMAMEAAAQIADKSRAIAYFRLRDVQFIAAAVATEQSDLEFTLQLRPHVTGTRGKASTWLEFVVSSSGDGVNLQKNCSGLLIIDYKSRGNSHLQRENDTEDAESKFQYLNATLHCGTIVDTGRFYTDLKAIGLIYGPAFANLDEIRNRDGQACGVVEIPDVPIVATEKLADKPHIIHPGTLDAIFHLAFAAVGGKHQLQSAMVPKSIDEVIVSANISHKAGTRLVGFSNAAKHGFTDLQADITMLDEHENSPVIQISGFCCSEIGSGNTGRSESKKICSKLTWAPVMDFLSVEEQKAVIENLGAIDLNDTLKHAIEQEEISALRHSNSSKDEVSLQAIFLETKSVIAILSKLSEVCCTKCCTLSQISCSIILPVPQTLPPFQPTNFNP
jgi:acyl transferase domain-containing protein